MPDFEELDHTADLGLRIRGASLVALFVHAAEALFALLLPGADADARAGTGTAGGTDEPAVQCDIALEAAAPDLLLREWLSELLYLHATRGLAFTRFEILDATETSLRARAGGAAMTPAMRARATEIKAVTYHGLRVHRSGDGYVAEVIFDT